jgi:hypothetical protein
VGKALGMELYSGRHLCYARSAVGSQANA